MMPWLFSMMWGCAAHRAIEGQVVDRNGQPMERVLVRIRPGGVELVTDSDGHYVVDYLRDSRGQKVFLTPKTTYSIELYRAGFHLDTEQVDYKHGRLELEPTTLVPETIRIAPSDEDIDPAKLTDKTHSEGSNYEGE